MPHPGKAAGEDYIHVPYLENWEPAEDRKWALKYIGALDNGADDFEGFVREYMERYPGMFIGSAPSYIPPTVDYFLRRDSQGKRMDWDHELLAIPVTQEERDAIQKTELQAKRQRRLQALMERGADIPEALRAEALPRPAPASEPEPTPPSDPPIQAEAGNPPEAPAEARRKPKPRYVRHDKPPHLGISDEELRKDD